MIILDTNVLSELLAPAPSVAVETWLAGRILPFDSEAADAFGSIAARRRKLGRPISQFDAQIAAIAWSRGASVATRNVADFADTGVTIINPWDHRP